MPPDPGRGAAPGWEPGTGPDTNPTTRFADRIPRSSSKPLRFLDGARLWIDHAAAGDIGIAEAAAAAQLLLARAEWMALAG